MNIPFIIARLKESGLTQSQIATEAGCSQSTISEMASGKTGTTRPSYKVVSGLQSAAKKRGIPLDQPVKPLVAPSARPRRKPPTVPA